MDNLLYKKQNALVALYMVYYTQLLLPVLSIFRSMETITIMEFSWESGKEISIHMRIHPDGMAA